MRIQVNIRIIDALKAIYGCETNKELALKLGISAQHLSRINQRRCEVPQWMKLLAEMGERDD